MKKLYKFAILGCGNGGKALAAQIASKGHSVNIFEALEPTKDFLKLQREKEIYVKGDITCNGNLNCVTADIEEAVSDRDIVLVVAPAFAHEPLFKLLIPHLKDEQKVIIIPGNYGTFLLKKMMSEYGISKNISISEVASLPYACRATEYNTVTVYKQKLKLKLATCPVEKNEEILNIMNEIADIYIYGENVLEVSLDNFNAILHPLPVLLNVAGIEKNPKNFRHYMDGISPLVSKKMEEMDKERMSIGEKYNLKLLSTLDQEKMYYGFNETQSIYEYVNSEESPYKDIYGQSVFGRYITEDLPYLVVPTKQLGEKVGVKTPVIDVCIALASKLHDKNYIETGYNLEKLGIKDMSMNKIIEYAIKM
ncbi:NAD/NADP-dependent octopine/nopaline dehydrogenase family protein [Tepidibacter aestuarii]|uniref:NAD/NADP-dependent octopine/nopaline dehydrogenase family protein n=1 Tax=Tepidibacter aestuarii TaxID=2925782 RepID=UPI0020BDFC9C|nr:NAD/NADP-dependent octopine/nopaline dehydrogenase family protein [Tepidibacter aestuarii]CAH2214708.1 opine dehydrogenase [Tepidibacter aestuarii]